MRAGSLFSGVGGLDLGLHRAGIRHEFFCEIDPWRRDVLAHHWPGIPIHHDIQHMGRNGQRELDGGAADAIRTRRQGNPHVDLICGGFPCQDLSVAGQRRGLKGDRSGLFFEYARIAQSLRPRWLLIENVPGLLSSNGGRDFGTVLGTLADIGYGMAWRTLDSRFFGVPQRRRRVYIVGTLADDDPRGAADRAGQVLAVGTRCKRHPATRTEARENAPDASDVGFALRRDPGGTGQGHNTNYVAGTLGGGAGERGWAQDTERMTFLAAPLSHGSNPNSNMAGRRREDDFNLVHGFHQTQDPISEANRTPALGRTSIGMGLGQGNNAVRRLTPVECERLQAWPDNWTNPAGKAPDSRRYAAAGDGVTATVTEWIGRRLMTIHSAVPTSPRSDDNNRTEKVTSA